MRSSAVRSAVGRATLLSILVATVVACAAAPPPVARPRAASEPTSLRDRARIELGCERTSLVELAPRHVAAAGCGAQREYRRMCASAGCDWIAIDDLAIRASFELECPVAELQVVTLGASSRGVIGCGVRATYVLLCQHEGCHWLPSSVHRAALPTHLRPASRLE